MVSKLNPNEKQVLYSVFSTIPLDIEGSNLENIGWMPSESDIKYIGEEGYFMRMK